MFYRFIVSISVALILTSCAQSAHTSLSFPFSEPEINIDADLGRDEWAKAVTLNGLIAPWENDNPDQTKFKAFISENYFNFIFQVEDNTLITQPFEKELSVAGGDRVELFLQVTGALTIITAWRWIPMVTSWIIRRRIIVNSMNNGISVALKYLPKQQNQVM